MSVSCGEQVMLLAVAGPSDGPGRGLGRVGLQCRDERQPVPDPVFVRLNFRIPCTFRSG